MNMKKSLIAMAVAGVVAAPMAAEAGGYGRVAVGVVTPNEDRATGSANPFATGGVAPGNGGDDFAVIDTSGYAGFRGEEDLGNGMAAIYDYQFDVNSANGTINVGSARQSYVGLSGDFGTVKLGRSTNPFYTHVGSTTDWGWGLAPQAYYDLGNDGIGSINGANYNGALLYPANSVAYSNENGPISFGAQIQMANDAGAGANNDVEDFDRMMLGGTLDLGNGTVSAAYDSYAAAGNAPEPTIVGLAGTWSFGDFGVRGSYVSMDRDQTGGNDSTTGFDLLGTASFGGGLSGFVGFSQTAYDQQNDVGDTTSVWGQISQDLSDRTLVYGEVLSQSVDGGTGSDVDPSEFGVGMVHYF